VNYGAIIILVCKKELCEMENIIANNIMHNIVYGFKYYCNYM